MITDMKKGTEIKFLDYLIKSCENNDGIVLLKDEPYDHLGNFSKLEDAKMSAVIHFMIARPDPFAQSIHNRIMNGPKSGCMYEWSNLKNVLLKEKIYASVEEFPEEIREPGDGSNFLIHFNGKPITWKSK